MIEPAKVPAALYAIQAVLVKARCLAAEGADSKRLYKLLDWGEILPSLLTRRPGEDTTEEFREMLAGLGEDFPECAGYLINFDRGVTWDNHVPFPTEVAGS